MTVCTTDAELRQLGQIARILEMAHHEAPEPGGSLVRLRLADGVPAPDDELEVSLAPIAHEDVIDALLGWEVPLGFDAAGVVVEGTARDLAAGGRGPWPALGRARTVFVCTRAGATASALRMPGREPVLELSASGEDGPVGRIPDAVRRSVGCATPAPEVPVDAAVARVWLHRIMQLAVAGARVDRTLVDALRPSTPASWAALREQAAAGGWVDLGVLPEVAAWMDEGMLSRWCLAAFPEPLEVLVELTELVPGDVAEEVAVRLAGSL